MCPDMFFRSGRKQEELFFYNIHNRMKILYLAYKNIGHKSLLFFQKIFVIEINLLSLQSLI